MLDAVKGPLLGLDAGNALFKNAGSASPDEKQRAALILDVMGRLGTRAAAVGQRDLSAGVAWLEAQARASPVKWLSANLLRGGKPVFPASATFEVGGVQVAVVGLSAPGPLAPERDVEAGAPLPAARAAIASLGRRDLTVVLAATGYAEALQLAAALRGQVDFIIQSGEFRGTQPPQRLDEKAPLLFAAGQRGQALARVAVKLGRGQGPFVDLSELEREQFELDLVTDRIARLDERIKGATDKAAIAEVRRTQADLKARKRAIEVARAEKLKPSARSVELTWVPLAMDVADDPAIKAEVLRFEPSYAGAH